MLSSNMVKELYELEGRGYLKSNNSDDYEMLRKLYFGKHWEVFQINEFDYPNSKYDYVAYNLVKFSIDTLANLYGINKATFDFGDAGVNNIFEQKRKQLDFDEKIEVLLRDYLLFGNGYVAINENEKGSQLENIRPELVYADYNEFNLGMEANKYTIKYEKEIKEGKIEYEVYLLVDYLEGKIILTAYKEQDDIYTQVKPLDYFSELFPNFQAQNTEVVEIDLASDYMGIVAVHNIQDDSFYGVSNLTDNAIGLQELVNKLGNLAKFAITQNAVPKLKLSESASKLLDQAIDEMTNENATFQRFSVPQSLTKVPTILNRGVNWLTSSIIGKIGKKLMFFRDNGQGNTEYLVNPYKLDDLFTFQKYSETKFLQEMSISPTLYNPEANSGNLTSGVAYKRLMTNTINFIENMRIKTADQLSIIAKLLMDLELKTDVKLPKVEFQPVVEEDVLPTTDLTTNQDLASNSNV